MENENAIEQKLTTEEVHKAIMAHLPLSENWDADDTREAAALLHAVLESLLGPDSHPYRVKQKLVGFENGYGCWLDEVENAIHKGLADLPARYGDFLKGQVLGAFHMSTAFLFDIEGHNDKFDRSS